MSNENQFLDIKGVQPCFPQVGHHERCRKRIRASHMGIPIVDTHHARYVWENQYFPTIYLPMEEIFDYEKCFRRMKNPPFNDQIHKTIFSKRLATLVLDGLALFLKGREITQVFHIKEGALAGFVRIPFRAIDTWKEEDDEIVGYPRDPYKRVDVHLCTRPIEIKLNHYVFKTNQAVVLFQQGFPPRFYFTRDLLRPVNRIENTEAEFTIAKSEKKTFCPYKGEAVYFDFDIQGKEYENIIWSYTRPNPEALLIKDRICFSNEMIEMKIDGVLQEQPAVPGDHLMSEEEKAMFSYDG